MNIIFKKYSLGSKISFVFTVVLLLSFVGLNFAQNAFATGKVSLSMSPMVQNITLNVGDEYTNSFKIYSTEADKEVNYSIEVQPFYMDENYATKFDLENEYTQMKDWITLGISNTGTIPVGEQVTVPYTINVPSDAPAGGQYASITVIIEEGSDGSQNATNIIEKAALGYTIYAEIAGTTVRQGEIIEADVPAFLLSGNITGISAIRNTGNVHSKATYKMQVFPLFSDEEVYTNEEKPDERTILPDRTLYNETEWAETPTFGIFNVIYTVEFEGVTAQVKKMVIVCPIWLLFAIILAAFLVIGWIVVKVRGRKKSYKKIN